jgi:4-hydroxy-2-oxoheptanedioate aldolase
MVAERVIVSANSFYRRIASNGIAVGSFHDLNDATVIELACAAGVDFVVLECEHSVRTDSEIRESVRAAEAWGVDVLARFDHDETLRMTRALELGVGGLIIPRVESATELEHILRILTFPPEGTRGVGAYRDMYRREGRQSWEEYAAQEREELVLFAMIESVEAASSGTLQEILAVERLTGIMAGPADMAASLTFVAPGDRRVVDGVRRVLRDTVAAPGKIAMAVTSSIEQAEDQVRAGARAVLLSLDTILLDAVYRARVASVRAQERRS